MQMTIYFLFVILAFPAVSSFDPYNRYCLIRKCPPGLHTMCAYPIAKPRKRCRRVIRAGLRENEKQRILSVHNNLRSWVYNGSETRGNPGPQPAAVRNVPLQWDEDLAKIAQRWVNQCKLYGDICRNLDAYYVGQNLIFQDFDEDMNEELQLHNLQELIQSWYNEVDKHNRNDAERFRALIALSTLNECTVHYTQIVWANTYKIGCGAIRFYTENFPVPKIFLVCNYAPSGNIEDEPLYVTL